jgi:L,D-peptidoglycan transpeptidase YkuD (ErfK/YbiS/YcfS/YnhG family)
LLRFPKEESGTFTLPYPQRKAKGVPIICIRRSAAGKGRRATLTIGHFTLPCALGAGGIRAIKREGDNATPRGLMKITGGYCDPRAKRRTGASWLEPSPTKLGWCDDPSDRNYNRPVPLPYRASHEILVREDGLYGICVVLDWNTRPRIRNRGSAIFLHVAAPQLQPTQGCIALKRGGLEKLIRRIGPGTRILVHA